MKKWKKIALIGGAVVALAGLVVGGIVWSRRGTVSVQVGTVGRDDLASIVTASGEVKPPPDKLANVNANSFGKITQLLVKEGDRVKKGQLLLRIQSADIVAAFSDYRKAVADQALAHS